MPKVQGTDKVVDSVLKPKTQARREGSSQSHISNT